MSMMNTPRRTAAVLAFAMTTVAVLGGCSTASKDITSTYVSLNQEAHRIQVRVVELGGRLDQAAQNDKALVGVGMILFWPALFALGGTKQQEAEYARLRGEYDAVQQSSIEKKCATPVPPAAPAPAASAAS